MNKKSIVRLLFIVLIAGLTAIGFGEQYNCWDCLGLKNCSDEQSDECRTYRTWDNPIWYYGCIGSCYKVDVGGTIDVCEQVCEPSSCLYNGGLACEGKVYWRACKVVPATAPDYGSICTGACEGEWEEDTGASGLHHCS